MKALVYHGPSRIAWADVPEPALVSPTDVVVRIDATTICTTDLRIVDSDTSRVAAGRVLGHEGIGTVVAVGSDVSALAAGDRVLIPAITSCGRCPNCRRGMPGHCASGGWVLGNVLDGLQAEYARVPYAESSVHKVPDTVTDVEALFLSDIVPTAYELGIRNGRVGPGDTVAVIGLGAVGLAAIMTAGIHGAGRVIAIGNSASRLILAEEFGASHVLDIGADDVRARLHEITDGEGVDVAIEAVGSPDTFELCTRIVRRGGVVANIGVHRAPVALHLEELWDKNVTITTGLVDTSSVPMLLRLVRDGQLSVGRLGTRELPLGRAVDAYGLLASGERHKMLKVVLRR